MAEVLSGAVEQILQRLPNGILVLDRERNLRFVNDRARRLLGYREGDGVGGRCRLTTRGVDCEAACPLTFALQQDLDRVEDFETVYSGKGGQPVRLAVTVIPLRDPEGQFQGAVEILRELEPDPGFFLAGSSLRAAELRERARVLAGGSSHLLLVGEPHARVDVARAIHRMSGLAETLFRLWPGSWDEVEPWPPGTMYVEGPSARGVLELEPPPGWRVMVGAPESSALSVASMLELAVLELPPLEDRPEDLVPMVIAWARQLAPDTEVEADAAACLARLGREAGLDRLAEILSAAVAAAKGTVSVHHLPVDGYGAAMVDELLRTPNPLLAAEGILIREVLERSGWRVQDAADRLGVSRVTLWRKMRDHGIGRPGCNGAAG